MIEPELGYLCGGFDSEDAVLVMECDEEAWVSV